MYWAKKILVRIIVIVVLAPRDVGCLFYVYIAYDDTL